MKKKDAISDQATDRIESFLLHERSLLEDQLKHNIDASESLMRFYVTLVTSGVAGMVLIPQLIPSGNNARLFLISGASSILWIIGFYYSILERGQFIARLDIYYKIFKIKIYFEKYKQLRSYIIEERNNSWILQSFINNNINEQPTSPNFMLYILVSSLFISIAGYFLATTILSILFSGLVSLAIFATHMIFLIRTTILKTTKSSESRRLSELINDKKV